MGKLLLIIFIAIVVFIIDAISNKCIQSHPEVIPVILLHHFIYIFALLGWILDDLFGLLVYIAVPIVIGLHWATNKNHCMVDEVTSGVCEEETRFRHLGYMLGLPNIVYNSVVTIGEIIAMIKVILILRSGQPSIPNKKCGPPPPLCANLNDLRKKGNTRLYYMPIVNA